MNDNNRKLRTRFEAETRFKLKPVVAETPPAAQAAAFTKLKDRLVRQLLEQAPAGNQNEFLRQVVTEAEALAWATTFPVLFFPELVEEKAVNARAWLERQEKIRARSQALVKEAA